ncbi:hypothetical protein CYY_007664 [Polysphondylium violaceum]|uniref:Core domain-containing protein n=1 Tax=Polysphondylium violaceum TaxID=133409 RepID=A0A8J4PWX7_9MYCE|nr:hypothetical protein CYY_007664 [Polysphondylium violaceum]
MFKRIVSVSINNSKSILYNNAHNGHAIKSFSRYCSTATTPILDKSDTMDKYNIDITDRCVDELNKIRETMNKDINLRVMVDMGGCSGYQYIIKLDEKFQEDDVLFTKNKANVIIDKMSLEMMEGSVIDYEKDLMRSSFCVASNPNTIKSCGCKISFDLKKK